VSSIISCYVLIATTLSFCSITCLHVYFLLPFIPSAVSIKTIFACFILYKFHILCMLFVFIYVHWCPSWYLYQITVVFSNSNMTGSTSGEGTANSFEITRIFGEVRVAQSLVFSVVFSRLFLVLLPLFYWALYWLSLFDLRVLISPFWYLQMKRFISLFIFITPMDVYISISGCNSYLTSKYFSSEIAEILRQLISIALFCSDRAIQHLDDTPHYIYFIL